MSPRATFPLVLLVLLAEAVPAEDPPSTGTPVPAEAVAAPAPAAPAPLAPTTQQQVESLLGRARVLSDAERNPLYEQAARLAPDRAEVWCNLAAAQIRSGQARRARGAIEKALALAPSLYEARLNAAALVCIEASSDGIVGNKSLPKLEPIAGDLASLRRDHPGRRGAAWTLLWIAFQRGEEGAMLAAATDAAPSGGGTQGLTEEEIHAVAARSARAGILSRAVARWAALAGTVDRTLVEQMPVFAQPPGSHVEEGGANEEVRAFLAASWSEDPALMERALTPIAGARGGVEVMPAAGLSILRLAVLHRRSVSPSLAYERGQRDALAALLPDLREKAVLEAALRAALRPVAAYVGEAEEP